MKLRINYITIYCLTIGIFLFQLMIGISTVFAATSDGFDYPIGCGPYPLSSYWNAQEFGNTINDYEKPHLGEDWNRGGGGDDYGDPVYAVSNGDIVYAQENVSGWGKVLIVRSSLPDGSQVEALYGHLKDMPIRSGSVQRGAQIGTIGNGDGLCVSHLHFEMRYSNCPKWGSPGPGYSTNTAGWTDPSNFIGSHRSLTNIPKDWSLVKQDGDSKVYLFYNSKKWWIKSEADLLALGFNWDQLVYYPANLLNSFSNGPDIISEDLLVKLGTPVYLMQNGKWCYVPNWTYMDCRGGHSDLLPINQALFDRYGRGPDLKLCYPPPDGSIIKEDGISTVYLFKNGKKFAFINEAIFNILGYSFADLLNYPAGSLSQYHNGPNIVSSGILGQLGTRVYLFQSDNKWHYLPDWIYMDCRGGQDVAKSNTIPINQAILDQYGTGTDITPCNVTITKGTWRITGSLNIPRVNHTATLLPNGKVLVAGGYKSGSPTLTSAELYDPATGTWSPTGFLIQGRSSHIAILLANGKVLVAGGWGFGFPLKSAEIYDPDSGTWSLTGFMNTARYWPKATILPNGQVLVVGGIEGNSSVDNLLASAELYDPITGTWSQTGSLNFGRVGHTETALKDGRVLVTGGYDESSATRYTSELYNPDTGVWSITGSMKNRRFGHTATLLDSGKVLAVGYLNDSPELYDPVTGTWSPSGFLPNTLVFHTATRLKNGQVLVAGDQSTDITAIDEANLYDPMAEKWAVTARLNQGRDKHTATMLKDGRVLVAGGENFVDKNELSSAEIYDPFGKPTNNSALFQLLLND